MATTQNLYATFGYDFGANIKDIQKTHYRLAVGLDRSQNCGRIRKYMLFTQLIHTRRILLDDFKRSNHDIQYKENCVTGPIGSTPAFNGMSIADLEAAKVRLQGILIHLKTEIANLDRLHSEVKKGKIPKEYGHIAVDSADEEDNITTITSVADLRAKLLSDQKKQKAIAKIITKDIKLKLSKFTLKACKTCDLIHELDARIKQVSDM